MKRTVASLLAVLLAVGPVLAGGGEPDPTQVKPTVAPPATLKEEGKIVFATDDSYPPMESREGDKIVGFDIDLATAVAAKMGLKAEFVSTKWDGLLEALAAKKVDAVISSMNVTPEREGKAGFVEYATLRPVIVVKKGGAKVQKPEDLKGKKVAVQGGTTSEAIAKRYAGAEHVTSLASFADAFEALKAGRAEAVVVDEPVAAYMAKKEPSAFEVAATAGEGEPVGIAVHREGAELKTAIAQAVKELKAEGVSATLSKRWLGLDITK